MKEAHRETARKIALKYLEAGDPLGWFEELYVQGSENSSIIPWADLAPNPNLVDWLNDRRYPLSGRALKIGSGLGDDAEELAQRGFDTIAFDISPSAIERSRVRFPESRVSYLVADLFTPPGEWKAGFDLVLESYTLQVLPPFLRREAIKIISSFVAPGGILLVITRGREEKEPVGNMPWPLTERELSTFNAQSLKELSFEDYRDCEDPPVRRFRVTYHRER